jgi:aconitate hydratase
VRATIERDGLLADLEAIGATVLANACGPCIGQWDRELLDPAEVNTIVTSFNRNFPRRNDGNASTKAFLTSPDMVVLLALAGTLDFDPLSDSLTTDGGEKVSFEPPVGEDLPAHGFDPGQSGHVDSDPCKDVAIAVSPDSDRLQLLAPYPAWDGHDYVGLPVLLKAKGKCTTDQISAAGKWLRYRGHLENISANLFLGVVNAFTGATGEGRDPVDGEVRSFAEIAKHLSDSGVAWCAVGDRSFARIHETNLKKQGILALTFSDPATYESIGEEDRISVLGLASLAPDEPVLCRVTKPDASTEEFTCTHTFSAEQVEWFKAGSALNVIRQRRPVVASRS